MWLIEEVVHHGVQMTYLTERYSLSRNYLSTMIGRYRAGNIVRVSAGRPATFDSPELRKLKSAVSGNAENTTVVDFNAIMQQERVTKVSNLKGTAPCSIPQVSRRTAARLIKRMNLRLGNAEQTTDARAIATANKFNAVSVAAAHSLMMPLTNPHIAINADGTSYQTGGGLTDKVKVIYDPEEQMSRGGPLKVLPIKGSSLTSYFVKFYLCMNATGTTAPPCYICADDNMKEGVIDTYAVNGLGIGTEVTSVGYVIFAKTRSVNEEFYRWWFTNIYVKFVMDLRINYNIPESVPSYFTLDGEDTQIKPMQTSEMANLCRELNIVIGKPPASTTSITQPCDAGKCFLASKTKKRNIKKISDLLEFTMSQRLKDVIKEHETRTGAKMPSHHVKYAIEGLQVVQYILQTTLRRDLIVESFKITGQYDPGEGKVDVDRILGQCKTPFSLKEVAKVKEVLPQLCDLLKKNGELKEKDYEVLGFDEGEHYHADRDKLVLNRRRFVFLTSTEVIASEDKKRQDKVDAGLQRVEKAAKRKIAAEEKKANGGLPKKRAKKNAALIPDLTDFPALA